MPVLFLLAVVGVVVAFRPSRSPGRDLAHAHAHARRAEAPATPRIAALRVPLVGAAAGTVGILTIAFIAERYLADVMPLLLLAALCGWHVVIDRWGRITGKRRVVGAALLAVLALFQLWTSFSLSLFYQRELGPVITIPQRAGLVSVQQRIDESLFGGPDARRGVRDPVAGPCNATGPGGDREVHRGLPVRRGTPGRRSSWEPAAVPSDSR